MYERSDWVKVPTVMDSLVFSIFFCWKLCSTETFIFFSMKILYFFFDILSTFVIKYFEIVKSEKTNNNDKCLN